MANRSQRGDLKFQKFHPEFSDKTFHFSFGLCSLPFSRVFFFWHRDRCKGDSLRYLKYRCIIKQTSAAPTSYSKVNSVLIWRWTAINIHLLQIVFYNSSGEEEDPGGGDPLSARGLCAVGLLRCPRKGKHCYLSFTLFICLSSLFHQRLHYWLAHLYRPICRTRRECVVCLFVYIFIKLWHSDSVHMQRDYSVSSENKEKEPFLPYKW